MPLTSSADIASIVLPVIVNLVTIWRKNHHLAVYDMKTFCREVQVQMFGLAEAIGELSFST